MLDVGCFDSPIPMWIEGVYAVDYSKNMIKLLKEKYPKANYMVADAMKLPFVEGFFDYVVAGEIIEHMEHPLAFANEMMRVLKVGGTLALTTPFEELISQPAVSDQHLWGFTAKDMTTLFEGYDVSIEIIDDPFKTLLVFVTK